MMNTKDIITTLEYKLPEYGRIVILEGKLSPQDKEEFLVDLDGVKQHKPEWHQWGIITHTMNFRRMYDAEVPAMIEAAGLGDRVAEHLAEKIGDKSKVELLRISIPLHDLGKFARTIRDSTGWRFTGHEKLSGHLINTRFQEEIESTYGLSPEQRAYVAKCAANHFELGHLRKSAKDNGDYTLAFTRSDGFKAAVDEKDWGDFNPEIGLLFLGDSLAKNDIRFHAETDEEIARYGPRARQIIAERGLNPELIETVLQNPVNMAAGIAYLTCKLQNGR